MLAKLKIYFEILEIEFVFLFCVAFSVKSIACFNNRNRFMFEIGVM